MKKDIFVCDSTPIGCNVGRSVCRSVCLSVGRSVGLSQTSFNFVKTYFSVCNLCLTYIRLMPFPSLIRKRKASTEASSEGYLSPLGGGFVKMVL